MANNVGDIEGKVLLDIDDLMDAVDRASRELDDLEDAADRADGAMDDIEDAADDAADEIDDLGDEADSAGDDLDDMGNRAGGLGDDVLKLASSLGRLVSSLGPVGGAAAGVAVGGLAAMASSVAITGAAALKAGKSYGTFEQAIRGAAAKTGNAVSAFDKFSNAAVQASQASAFTGKEAGEALNFLAASGLNADKAIKALPDTLKLATAGQMGLAEATDVTTSVMATMGTKASEVDQVASTMVNTSNRFKVSVKGMGEGVKNFGATANALGMSVERTSALIGLMAQRLGARKGSISLRQAMSKLMNPSKQAQEILDRVGVSAKDSEGKMKGLVEIMDELSKTDISVPELKKVFGSRGFGAADALMDSGGRGKVKDVTQQNQKLQGQHKEQAAFMNRGLQKSIDNLAGSWENLWIVLGEKFAPALKSVIEDTKGFVVNLKELVQQNESLGPNMMEVAKTAGRWIKAFEELSPILLTVLDAAVELTDWALSYVESTLRVMPVVGTFINVLDGLRLAYEYVAGSAEDAAKKTDEMRASTGKAKSAAAAASAASRASTSDEEDVGFVGPKQKDAGPAEDKGKGPPSTFGGLTAGQKKRLQFSKEAVGKAKNDIKRLRNQMDDVTGDKKLELKLEIKNKQAFVSDVQSSMARIRGNEQQAISRGLDASEQNETAGDLRKELRLKQTPAMLQAPSGTRDSQRGKFTETRGRATTPQQRRKNLAGARQQFQAAGRQPKSPFEGIDIKTEALTQEFKTINDVTARASSGLARITSAISGLKGVSDDARRALTATSTALNSVSGIATNLASGNIVGAITAGIGGAIETVAAAQKNKNRSKKEMTDFGEEIGKSAGKEMSKNLDQLTVIQAAPRQQRAGSAPQDRSGRDVRQAQDQLNREQEERN